MKLRDIFETLEPDLQDPEFVQVYLEEALQDGIPNFLMALRNVVQANQGMSALARETELGRENLYKVLSEGGNPQLATVDKILKALGMQLTVTSLTNAPTSK